MRIFWCYVLLLSIILPSGIKASNEVVYRGMKFECDRGCGECDDPDMEAIESIFQETVQKLFPLYDICMLDINFRSQRVHPWEQNSENSYYVYDWKASKGIFDEIIPRQSIAISSYAQFWAAANLLQEDVGYYLITQPLLQLDAYQKMILKLKNIKSREPLAVNFEDGELQLSHFSSYLACNVRTIPEVIEDFRRRIQYIQEDIPKNATDYQEKKSILDKAVKEMDSLFQDIFVFCLENHQPEGITFNQAMESFITGDLDQALEKIRHLIELSEKNDMGNDFVSELYLLQGRVQAEFSKYADAIVALTSAIEKNPSLLEAYLERAAAYFELGEFDKAIEDYLEQRDPDLLDYHTYAEYMEFGKSFIGGVQKGVSEGCSEFVPSTLASLKGMGNFIWATITHPIETPRKIIFAALEFCSHLSKCNLEEISGLLVPELHDLILQWNQLNHSERGKGLGHAVGKYGLEIFSPIAISKGANIYKSFQQIKKLEKCCALESLADKTRKAATLQAATKFAEKRKQQLSKICIEADKQGKHNPKHKNFKPGKSEFLHDNPQKLLDEFGGKGQKIAGEFGNPGYKERIDCGEIIGYYVNAKTNERLLTSKATIHYSKNGAHIVPAKP